MVTFVSLVLAQGSCFLTTQHGELLRKWFCFDLKQNVTVHRRRTKKRVSGGDSEVRSLVHSSLMTSGAGFISVLRKERKKRGCPPPSRRRHVNIEVPAHLSPPWGLPRVSFLTCAADTPLRRSFHGQSFAPPALSAPRSWSFPLLASPPPWGWNSFPG